MLVGTSLVLSFCMEKKASSGTSAHCKKHQGCGRQNPERKELVWSSENPLPVLSSRALFALGKIFLVLALCMEPRTNKRSRGTGESKSLALAWLWLSFSVVKNDKRDKQEKAEGVLGAAPRRRTERWKRLCLVDQERGKRRKSAHTQSSRGRGELDIEGSGSVRRSIASGRGRV